MSAPDPTGASPARASGPSERLKVGQVVTAVVYDIVGERGGRFAQRRAGICDLRRYLAEF